MSLTPLLTPMSLPTGLEASAREHALKMKIRSLKVQVCKLKAEVNRLKKTRKACVNKESVMKQLKKLLPAKAYAFTSKSISTTDIPADSQYTFLKDKQYTELNLGEKSLKVASMALVDLVKALESNFQRNK